MAEKQAPIGLKRSEVLKIEAAIVEIMEKADFTVDENVDMKPSKEGDNYMMSFLKGKTSLQELNSIQKELGEKFTLAIIPKDKNLVVVTLEASQQEFVNLLRKKETSAPSAKHDSLFDNQG